MTTEPMPSPLKPTLLDFEEQLLTALMQELEATDGVPESEPSETLMSHIAELVHATEAKRDRVAAMILKLENDAQACDEEAQRLHRRRNAKLKAAARLGGYVIEVMQRTGQRRLDGPLHTLTMLKGVKRVEVTDPEALHQDGRYVRIPVAEPAPDLRRLREAIEAGEEIEFARLVEGPPKLRVR